MLKHFATKENRALLSELVRTDFKLRYQGSVLGYAWSLLRPLFIFIILYLVFVQGLKVGGGLPHFPVYLLLGIVIWQFFADITTQGLSSIVSRGDLIRKIRIPRWMIVLTSSFSALINLGLNLLVVSVFMIIGGVEVSRSVFWLPFALLEIYLLGVGITLLLSAAYVKFRDVSFIWDIVIQAGFYVTPIIYSLGAISSPLYKKIITVNPVAQVIQDARSSVVTKETLTIAEAWGTGNARLIPIAIILTVLVLGVLYFKRQAPYFAENL